MTAADGGYRRSTLVRHLRELTDELGRPPSTREMCAAEGRPTTRPFYRVFGDWDTACREAGVRRDRRDDPDDPAVVVPGRRTVHHQVGEDGLPACQVGDRLSPDDVRVIERTDAEAWYDRCCNPGCYGTELDRDNDGGETVAAVRDGESDTDAESITVPVLDEDDGPTPGGRADPATRGGGR